jgi:hypothetical protein
MKTISDYIKERWLEYLFNACEANFAYYSDYESKNSYLDDLTQELLHSNLTWGWGINDRQGLHNMCCTLIRARVKSHFIPNIVSLGQTTIKNGMVCVRLTSESDCS